MSRYIAFIALAVLIGGALPSAAQAPIELRVEDEVVPQGGIVQMKVSVTESKPISTGRGRFRSSALPFLAGLVVLSSANDTFGAAVLDGTSLTVSAVSTAFAFGTDTDYPILAAALRVPETMAIGTVVPFEMEPGSLVFRDPAGAVYPTLFENGAFTVTRRALSIDDVIPGSADLPAGATVTILGRGFLPSTRIRFNEVELSQTRYISARRIDVVLDEPARMHGMRIRAENDDSPRLEYFSYERTTLLGATQTPGLQNVIPLFAHQPVLDASVVVARPTTGLAVENLQGAAVRVTIDLLRPTGEIMATTRIRIPPSRYILRDVTELFAVAVPRNARLRVRAPSPVEVMGIRVSAAGVVDPILAN
jgi:hypothetical protein